MEDVALKWSLEKLFHHWTSAQMLIAEIQKEITWSENLNNEKQR